VDFFTPLNMLYVLLVIFMIYNIALHIRIERLNGRLEKFSDTYLRTSPRRAKHKANDGE
jgi:hypothetical protein